jgi:hypothetical protein
MAASTYITDLTNQCVRVGELRSAVKDGSMKESDVREGGGGGEREKVR